jgi:signal peptidase I
MKASFKKPVKKNKNEQDPSLHAVLYRRMQKEKSKRELFSILASFGFWILFAVLLFHYVLGLWMVNTQDMAPTFHYGDLLLYTRFDQDIDTDDLIVYQQDGVLYCGKVVLAQNGTVLSNEKEMLEFSSLPSCFLSKEIPAYESAVSYPLQAKSGQYFVLSYDLENGKDSRMFGLIDQNQIKGKVLLALLVFGL